MNSFENVKVTKEVNNYFEGRMTSRTLILEDGSIKTLDVVLPGEYEFGTGDPELMEIYSGDLEVKLPGSDVWQTVRGGESFNVEGDAKFQARVQSMTDYCCSFLKEE
ncbi:MAG: pyrimidine/purine nucleoside phosphorylase [Campylobacterota bacterium]|nr:pyrimidine/purine nucleoside phosphorylase [Campylobacterota bacterium]